MATHSIGTLCRYVICSLKLPVRSLLSTKRYKTAAANMALSSCRDWTSFSQSCSTEIVGNALALKLLSSRSGSKWPGMISSGGVRTNHDTSCNACYHAMAPPVLRIQHGNSPLPTQFACDRVLLPVVRRCTNAVIGKCSAPLDRHIDIELSSKNIS